MTEEEKPKDVPDVNTDVPEESKTPTPPTSLDKYQAENNRREELLKQETELQERKEKLHTEQMLGGHSEAGQAPEPKKELTPTEYKDQVMGGETPK